MIVCELVDRYLKTKTGVRQSTKQGYVTVQRLLAKEAFGKKTIRSVKTSDAKLFLIKLQQEDGKSYSSIHTIRGVLRPAFQMVVDDDILVKNPFGFQLAGVLVNDAVTREAITKDQMRKFLKFVHDDVVYCKYYEVVYILCLLYTSDMSFLSKLSSNPTRFLLRFYYDCCTHLAKFC